MGTVPPAVRLGSALRKRAIAKPATMAPMKNVSGRARAVSVAAVTRSFMLRERIVPERSSKLAAARRT
jgi:hypothetical protein